MIDASMDNYQQFFADTIPYLRRYARAYTGDVVTGDALVRRTIECAHSLINFLRDDTDIAIWLFSIMHNITLEERKETENHPDNGVLDIDDSDMTLLEDIDLEEIDIVTALTQLPAEQKEAFLLVGLERFTYEEASEILNVPIGTLILRLNSARKFLIKRLLADDFAEIRAAQ
ncbi:RNA polymerase sigma factor [Kaarinaea lacus]